MDRYESRFATRRSTVLGLGCGIVLLTMTAAGFAEATSPVGLWRTFDDRTGRERGLVRIWEQGGVLYGSIAGIVNPTAAKRNCDKCEDDRKGKPLLGLEIIRGLRKDGGQWDGGQILDPETGETYRCSMRLTEDGGTLVVRGYLGISLFGRSQTWRRVE